MNYYLDCEFDGFGGPLLSIALVREDNEALYLVLKHNLSQVKDEWVKANVVPIMMSIPHPLPGMCYVVNSDAEVSRCLQDYFKGDSSPNIITDWPDDITYFCKAIMTGPGYMISIPSLKFEMHRVDAYPTKLKNAVQHNSYWDAMALKELFR